jgi:hypothetical protein
MISNADQAFDYIETQISSNGTLTNVVDPFNWSTPATQSPEAQAFVLLLQAAWRDYTAWKESGSGPILISNNGDLLPWGSTILCATLLLVQFTLLLSFCRYVLSFLLQQSKKPGIWLFEPLNEFPHNVWAQITTWRWT